MSEQFEQIIIYVSLSIIGITIAILLVWAVFPNFTPFPFEVDKGPQPGDIVKCSNYEKVIDRYMVPGPEFHIVTDVSGYKLDRTLSEGYNYSDYQIGTYAQFPKKRAYTFEELNETETGYRNACKVIAYV